MSAAVWCAVIAYLLTTLCAWLLMRRAANWRIRFLSFIVGLMPLCQVINLLASKGLWVLPTQYYLGDIVELLVAAACLSAIHLLRGEIRDRRQTDSRLRLAESELPGPAATPVRTMNVGRAEV